MIEIFGWLATVAGAVGVVGLTLLLVPPTQYAVRAWLSTLSLPADDASVAAVRGAALRMSYAGGAVFLVVTVVGLAAQFKAVSAAVALTFAVVTAASVRVEGGSRRRADLSPVDGSTSRSWLLIGGTALGGMVTIGAVALAALHAERSGPNSSVVLESGSDMPAVESYTLPVVAAASALLAIAAWLGHRHVLRRQSLATVGAGVDQALRGAGIRRIAAGAVSGQMVLLGIVVSATPLLAETAAPVTPEPTVWLPDPGAISAAGDVGLGIVVTGLVVAAVSLFTPFWSATVRAARLVPAKEA